MAVLKFLGRGSAFTDDQNSAYFTLDNKFILIDCSMNAFNKIRKYKLLNNMQQIIILVTHTHLDHIAGIPMLIDYATYVAGIKTIVVCPRSIMNEMVFLMRGLEGCDESWYTILTTDVIEARHINLGFGIRSIMTSHVPNMKGKCFGYMLKVGSKTIVYSGDTNTLVPYIEYLKDGVEFYVESSARHYDCHLDIHETLDIFKKLTEAGVKVYIMHIDNESHIRSMIEGTEIKLAPLYRYFKKS